MNDQWLSADQAGYLLNIKSRETIYKAFREGAFGNMAIMVGGQLRFNPAFFQSVHTAARTSAIVEMADDLIRRANALKELAQEAEAPIKMGRRRGLALVDDTLPASRQHAGD